ncbi:MAG TPA: glycosyltransferase [Methanoregulaceae archaeon]|nr:glycosyltransferase [Methanoregulaceae archaeon]HQP82369.1 glycosyltransferase [Methanoregulaceae archaeon]
MTISVIISSYRGNEFLIKSCIESINLQTVPPSEIIVVLDTKEEKDLFATYLADSTQIPITFVHSDKRGLAAARNKGVKTSIGDIIAFIDDDAFAEPQWIQEILRAFTSKPSVGVVGGPVIPLFEGQTISEKYYWVIGCTSDRFGSPRPIGCNVSFRREIFEYIGYFNEDLGRVKKRLGVAEETELILRIQKQLPWYSVIFNERVRVFHKTPEKRTKLSYFIKRAYQEGFAKAMIKKEYELKEEMKYLRYFLNHLDPRSFLVLSCIGCGYLTCIVHIFIEEHTSPELKAP